MPRHWSPDAAFAVLFVCTGNICRSAMAERVSRAYLDDALAGDAATVRVESAGTQAVVGSGVHPDSALVLSGFGGDGAGFAARQLVDDMAIDADLTLTLTRAHRRTVLSAAPRALSRTFTLLEAAALVQLVDPDAVLSGHTYAERCRSLVKAMAAARSQRQGEGDDDVPDPISQPLQVHQQVGETITQALLPLLSRLVALREAPGAAAGGQAPLTRAG